MILGKINHAQVSNLKPGTLQRKIFNPIEGFTNGSVAPKTISRYTMYQTSARMHVTVLNFNFEIVREIMLEIILSRRLTYISKLKSYINLVLE